MVLCKHNPTSLVQMSLSTGNKELLIFIFNLEGFEQPCPAKTASCYHGVTEATDIQNAEHQ